MRPRLAAPLAALLLLAAIPGSVAARPAIEFTVGDITVFSASCDDYFVLVDLSWTGATANGATQETGTWTTPGILDTVTGEPGYGWRPPDHDGSMVVIFSGPFEPGDQIGALVTLRMGSNRLRPRSGARSRRRSSTAAPAHLSLRRTRPRVTRSGGGREEARARCPGFVPGSSEGQLQPLVLPQLRHL